MTIDQVMKTEVITINKNKTYKEAIKILFDNKISGAPVVDDNGNVVGMFSEKDVFKVLYPFYKSFYEHPEEYTDPETREHKALEIQNYKVERLMVTNLISIHPKEKVMAAGGLMLAKGIHRLPVIEDGKMIGIVTRRDIYHSILKRELGV
jgi:CBS domain-containing protein